VKIAFFSPLPPAKSGIADYSAALLEPLRQRAQVEVFTDSAAGFDPARFNVALYQLGNNPYHAVAYETALRHPGVVVMHEANLHHLIADQTIKRGDWDGYLREVEFDGGPTALQFAREQVHTLKRGPDYEGVPMLRRVLAQARGVIAHSHCVLGDVRKAGFAGPTARIWHGAWLPDGDRMAFRTRLGLDEFTPLVGIFGFLKPYKRIAEALRAFRRLVKFEPQAKMILVGEPHPELPLESLISSLGLSAHVRVLGFTPIADFEGFLAACDVVLNLRFPTVGESSGTLLRALGLGKAVVVSDVGSFSEYPDEIVLKTPVDASEEDHLFEYLSLLVSRPELARQMGAAARDWVARECRWDRVADQYAGFLEAVVSGREWQPAASEPGGAPASAVVEGSDILRWAEAAGSLEYGQQHVTRLTKTLSLIPPAASPGARILEMGAYMQITPLLREKLGYGEVRGCYFGRAGEQDHKTVRAGDVEFSCIIDLFNAEKDRFPYPDEYFDTVLCGELIEHLFEDPMFLMSEINRILKPAGHVVLTTPNIVSLRAVSAILQGFHPGFFPAYIRPNEAGEVDARHNREYTPREMGDLLGAAGFETIRLETGEFYDAPKPELAWVDHLLERYMLTRDHRGDGIYAVGRKRGPVRERFPAWLYT
jgi:glycosyltransferase involved in cell wall biosynthesis/SAM-dependent methyltransferase